MKYLVTSQQRLFESDAYTCITVEESLNLLSPLKIIGVDTETDGFDVFTKALKTLQLGCYDFQIMIDCSTIDILLYKPLLEDTTKLFLFWNAKFDLKFLYRKGIVPFCVYDGYLAEKLLYQGYKPGTHSMSLQSVVQTYMNVYLDKSVRGEIIYKDLTERIIVYGCTDVKYLEKIKEFQEEKLKEHDLLRALQIENEFVKVLAYIEYSGIKLDRNKWLTKMAKDQEALKVALDHLNNWIITNSNHDRFFLKYVQVDNQGDLFTGFNNTPICNINWNSSQQLIPLFEHLGFNLWTKDKNTGLRKKSVEAKVLDLQKEVSTILVPYLEYTSQAKLVSTYGQTFLHQINPVTQRIHTQFNQLMDTGRLSCGGKNKSTREEYVNIQNLPSDEITRSCFVAEEEYSLIDCDYTAQEDFVFTELSQEPKLIDFYNETTRKRDGHSFTAKICFPEELKDVEEEDVKSKRPDLRALAKKAKFSIHYGGNGSTIAKNLALPEAQGYAIEKSYLQGFSNIDVYFKAVKKQMWDNGYILISPLTGHKMFIPHWDELKEEETAFNSEFWDQYKPIKKLWMESGADVENKPQIMQRVSRFFKSKSGYERNSLNAPVQGTSAIVTKIAGIKYFNHLIKNNLLFTVWIPNCVHDEYLVEVPDELIEQESIALKDAMNSAGDIFCKSVKLRAVPEVAKHWVH